MNPFESFQSFGLVCGLLLVASNLIKANLHTGDKRRDDLLWTIVYMLLVIWMTQ